MRAVCQVHPQGAPKSSIGSGRPWAPARGGCRRGAGRAGAAGSGISRALAVSPGRRWVAASPVSGAGRGFCKLRTASLPSLLPAPGADRCSRAATQDKAVKRYVVRNIVDAASLRDITEACAIEGAPPRIQPAASTRMPAPRMLGAEGGPGLCGGGARGSASSPLRPLPAHEHRLTFPAAVDLRLRAAEALPQDVLLHLCGDPLALRARAVAHQPPQACAAAALRSAARGQARRQRNCRQVGHS